MEFIVFLGIALFIAAMFWVGIKMSDTRWKKPKRNLSTKAKVFLHEHVQFYRSLNPEEKVLFEFKVNEFMTNVKILGVNCLLDMEDLLLVASSAVIPIFSFPNWQYVNLQEVLVFPSSFNTKFQSGRRDSNILGLVGDGPMDGKMILSQKALRQGFHNEEDGHNTAIHEFIHLIDKMDGNVDGVPSLLLQRQYVIPWLSLVDSYIQNIRKGKSDFNPYGGSNRIEFFAVMSEYFFEKPQELKRDHPKLYAVLEGIFRTKMAKRKLGRISPTRPNDLCPCGSGKKFKHCCSMD